MDQNIKIDPFGFREYDARWMYEKDINQSGIENLGKGLGTQKKIHTKKDNPRIVVGHDYRSYSEEIKTALKKGLLSTGCNIEDIGLSLSPMVYFAQFNLDSDAVAMVTASHNENGWTGVKMGIKKGLTHAPEEMKQLKDITLNKDFIIGQGKEKEIKNFKKIYEKDLTDKNKINKKIKAVVACGNGTAGIFAPNILRSVGCEVIELDCNLDWTFPKYNPNPEDLEMLHEIAKAVKENNALFLVKNLNPNHYLPFDIPGVEILISILLITIVGGLSLSFFGRRILKLIDDLFKRIPFLRTVYSAIVQMTETFSKKDDNKKSVVLVEYPRKGVWAVGFATKENTGEMTEKTNKKLINVFVPTTPNPTSGFLLMFPIEDVIYLNMSFEEASKFIVSAGTSNKQS